MGCSKHLTNKKMINKEFYRTREDGIALFRTFSTDNLYIRKLGTEEMYEEAIDVENAPYEYEETGEVIEVAEEIAEIKEG